MIWMHTTYNLVLGMNILYMLVTITAYGYGILRTKTTVAYSNIAIGVNVQKYFILCLSVVISLPLCGKVQINSGLDH